MYFLIPTMSHALLYFPEQKYAEIKRFWMIRANYILSGILYAAALFLVIRYNVFSMTLLCIPLVYILLLEINFPEKTSKKLPGPDPLNQNLFIYIVWLYCSGLSLFLLWIHFPSARIHYFPFLCYSSSFCHYDSYAIVYMVSICACVYRHFIF